MVLQRPAPVQVSFLVYPGTSGSAALDYLVADAVVVPPEHARWYTEKLVLFLGTYQVNHYSLQSVQRADEGMRAALGRAGHKDGKGGRGGAAKPQGVVGAPEGGETLAGTLRALA